MFLKKFTTAVLLRLSILFALLVALSFTLGKGDFIFTQLALLVILGLGMVEFFRYITRTNRDLAKFILALKHRDFSVNFGHRQQGSGFDELHSSFRELLAHYRENRLEKEEHFQLMQNLVDRMPVGLMVCNATGDVVILNRFAADLIAVSTLATLGRLEKFAPGIPERLRSLPLEIPHSITMHTAGQLRELTVQRTQLKTRETLDVYVFQYLRDAYDNKEMDAWLKLIRILTHEIMNTVTSITSLSSTALQLSGQFAAPVELTEALRSIHNRTSGMLNFADDYRRLTNVPAPRKQWFSLLALAREQAGVLRDMISEGGVSVSFEGSEKLQVHADPGQVAQVIINLLLNALHALEHRPHPTICLAVEKTGKNTTLSVTDNGKGIAAEEMGQVFIPFYSTREDGSGIGLSLCRQIMRNHGGSIYLRSEAGVGSTFTIAFSE